MDLLKKLARFLPVDRETKAGWGIFTLPKSAAWMEPVFAYHDHYYEVGPKIGMRLSDIDWRIFRALTIKAAEVEDPMERCRRARQICRYWPIMRSFGHYMYGRRHGG